jgi:hypothetical protein
LLLTTNPDPDAVNCVASTLILTTDSDAWRTDEGTLTAADAVPQGSSRTEVSKSAARNVLLIFNSSPPIKS